MRIVVDTNIVFSAILNANSPISGILVQPRSKLNFYTTQQLLIEIESHRNKIKKLSSYSDLELSSVIKFVTSKVKFIRVQLIPKEIYQQAEILTSDIDIDDTEFVALAEHLKAKLWTGDKVLIKGLGQKGWNRFITTNELYNRAFVGK